MKIISLDVGHGLKTAGKQTPDGVKEWEICDKVRDTIVELLKDYDVKFIFPDNNEGNVDEKLTTRRQVYITANADVCVSLHLNAYKGKWGKHTGTEVWVDKNCTAKDMELAEAIAIAGKAVTPGGAVELCHILGKDEVVRRMKIGMEKLK